MRCIPTLIGLQPCGACSTDSFLLAICTVLECCGNGRPDFVWLLLASIDGDKPMNPDRKGRMHGDVHAMRCIPTLIGLQPCGACSTDSFLLAICTVLECCGNGRPDFVWLLLASIDGDKPMNPDRKGRMHGDVHAMRCIPTLIGLQPCGACSTDSFLLAICTVLECCGKGCGKYKKSPRDAPTPPFFRPPPVFGQKNPIRSEKIPDFYKNSRDIKSLQKNAFRTKKKDRDPNFAKPPGQNSFQTKRADPNFAKLLPTKTQFLPNPPPPPIHY